MVITWLIFFGKKEIDKAALISWYYLFCSLLGSIVLRRKRRSPCTAWKKEIVAINVGDIESFFFLANTAVNI